MLFLLLTTNLWIKLLWVCSYCVNSFKRKFCFYTSGDGEDNRPGMRGGHQMVIDVQTGERYL